MSRIFTLLLALALALALACAEEDSAGATFAVHGDKVHISTPRGNGTVLIDGSLDVKALAKSIGGKVAVAEALNATLQSALGVSQQRQV
jgi:hypothetical protein